VKREPLRSLFAPDPSNLNHLPTAEPATWRNTINQMIESTKKGMASSYRIVEFDGKGHDAEPHNLNVGGKNRKNHRLLFILLGSMRDIS
jgi:hypothetical protein